MPLGTEVGLGLRDIMFDVDPATPTKRAHPPHPIFGPCLLWPRSPLSDTAELLLLKIKIITVLVYKFVESKVVSDIAIFVLKRDIKLQLTC